MAVLFIIAKICNQTEYLSSNKMINEINVAYILNGTVIRHRNKILSFGTAWMNLCNIISRELRRHRKTKHLMNLLTCKIVTLRKMNTRDCRPQNCVDVGKRTENSLRWEKQLLEIYYT
jgi:hypothetical protein